MPRSLMVFVPSHRPSAAAVDLFPAHCMDAGWVGFTLANLPAVAEKRLLWVQDRLSGRETGRPAIPQSLQIGLSHPRDALIAAEEGLQTPGIAAVIVEIWGEPTILDFTATKRLAFRAGRHCTPCWLIRHAATPRPSAMRDRWRVASLPSLPDRDDVIAPGVARWRADLFRSRDRKPNVWIVEHDPTHGLRFVPESGDGAVARPLPPERRSTAG